MRKNRTMRVAALLLALTLITSCFVGGTFAKYTTSNDAEDGARVAKWGVNFSLTKTDGKDLFTTSYAENNANQSTGVSVKHVSDKLVAPGTEGNLITFNVTTEENNAPEVSYEVTFDVTDGYQTVSLKQGSQTYEPIQWTVKLGDGTETTYATMKEMIAAIEAYKFYYNVDDSMYYEWNGTNWETSGSSTAPAVTVNWSWTFNKSDDYDTYDTILGNAAAGIGAPDGVTSNLNVEIELKATATQLD